MLLRAVYLPGLLVLVCFSTLALGKFVLRSLDLTICFKEDFVFQIAAPPIVHAPGVG